jgi:hypothetical protein
MDAQTCGACRYGQTFGQLMGWTDEECRVVNGTGTESISCLYPAKLMPLSMQGVAQREREPVEADATGCPCWSATTPEGI